LFSANKITAGCLNQLIELLAVSRGKSEPFWRWIWPFDAAEGPFIGWSSLLNQITW